MARITQRIKVVGNTGRLAFGSGRPKKKKYKRSGGGHGARSSNPGHIVGFTLAGNPGGKAKRMAQTKKKYAAKKSSKARGSGKKYKRNTGSKSHHHPMKAHRYKRNPSTAGATLTNGLFVIVGALGSKLGTQAVLGTKNTGLLGYAGNAAVGGALWFLTSRFMHNRAASDGVIAGTVVQILLRIINDYTPFGQYIAQLGMGDYQMQSFVTPQVLVDPMGSAEIAIPPGWAPRMLPPPTAPNNGAAAGGMAGLYGSSSWGSLYQA